MEMGGVTDRPTLYATTAAPQLAHLTIRGGGGDGLQVAGLSGLTLVTSTIASNEGAGIRIEGGNGDHALRAVSVAYNGGDGLYLDHAGEIDVVSATLAHNGGYGVRVVHNSNELSMTGSAIRENGVAARLPAGTSLGDNDWADNARQEVEWLGGTLSGPRTWSATPFDAHVVLGTVTVDSAAALTVTAGTEVRFEDGGLFVYGRLSAVGDADNPVTFAPADEGATWYGIELVGGEGYYGGDSRLSYAIIRGATTGLELDACAPALDHLALIENGTGLAAGDASGARITTSNFVSNTNYGLFNSTPADGFDAEDNFWNSTDGPYHASLNPGGNGDRVSDGVDFDPWLERPTVIAGVNYVLANRTATDHSTLAYDAGSGTYTRYYPDGTAVHFDVEGRHDYTLEPDGRKTRYIYNPDGSVATLSITATGVITPWTWSFTYQDGVLSSISDPAGRETGVSVDGNGQLTQVTFPDGGSRQFYYDQRGLLTQQVDAEGHATDYAYDANGRLAEHSGPQREVYDAATGERTAGREVKRFTPSATGYALLNASAVGDPESPAPAVLTSTLLVDQISYGRGGLSGHTNRWGAWLDRTDGLSHTTTYERDERNFVTRLIRPAGDCVETDRDGNGNPTSVVRIGATQCSLPPGERDGSQQQVTGMTYESRFNQVKTRTDQLGRTTTYYYDYELGTGELGNLVRIEYPAVRDEDGVLATPVVSFTYNSLGALETETDERGTVTRYLYTEGTANEADTGANPLFAPGVMPMPGLLTQVIRDDGGIELTTIYRDFDAQGNALTVVGPGGDHVTRYAYDAMGRVISETSPLEVATLFFYDGDGNLVRQVMDHGGEPVITVYTYEAGSHLASEWATADGLAASASYAYDSNGLQSFQTDVLGHRNTFGYDAANQVIFATTTAGEVVSYSHNLNGRIETVTNVDGTLLRQLYDALGRTRGSIANWQEGVFDPDNPDEDVGTFALYDAAGNTIVVTDTLGNVTRTWYDDRNRVRGQIGNWDGSTTLEGCGGLSSLRDENICTLYAYDLAGNTVVITDTLGRTMRTFYDALGRTEAVVANWNPATLSSPQDCTLSPTNESVENVCTLYGYDAAGNQVTITNALSQTSLTVYDAANRPIIDVANWDGTSIEDEGDCSFPPAGPDTNLCTVTSYDARDRVTAVGEPLGNLTEFGYNGFGQLVTVTRTLDGQPVTAINAYDAAGNLVGQRDALGHTTIYVYRCMGLSRGKWQVGI